MTTIIPQSPDGSESPVDRIESCDCIEQFDKALAEMNLKLDTNMVIQFHGTKTVMFLRVPINTLKADKSKKGKLRQVVAKYCPFCGAAYPEAPQ